jgi:hypothetical protein
LAHFLDLFVNSRSARDEYHTHEKSVRFARRALSASLSWGKHRLSQEAGLFGDVLLHRSIVTEISVFFQWYLLITVITHSYEPVCIRRSWRMLTRFLIVRNILLGDYLVVGPDWKAQTPPGIKKVFRCSDYPCSKKLRLSKYSQTPRCACILGRRPFRSRRSRPSQRQILYPSLCSVLRKFLHAYCLYPHISSSAAASDSGGFAFFRARQIVLPSTSPDIERFPVRKTFGIRSSASTDCESEKHCKYGN